MKLSYLKHAIFKNFVALSTLQGVNLILPFVTLPYLTKVLGVSNYGVTVMIYSIMQLLIVLCDYGFNLSATKEVSLFREDKGKINSIFSGITIFKFFLLIVAITILLFLTLFVPIISENSTAYFFGFGMVVGQAITPTWLFQGMEKMKYMTFVNLASKLTFTLLIFIVIKKPDDYIIVPLLYSIGFVFAGLLSLYFAIKEFNVKFKFVRLREILNQANKSTQYFYSRISVSLYTSSNNFIAGLIFGEYFAGIFGVAERIYTAMTVVYSPLSEAIYPHMVKTKNLKLFRKVFSGAFIVNSLVCVFVYIFATELVLFVFGEGFSESSELLKYFCFLAFIIVPATLVGYPLLGAFGFEKYANYSIVVASVVHVTILVITYSMLTVYSMIGLLIVTQILVLTIRLKGVHSLFSKMIRHD